jgi:hypothetical protein
MARALRVVCLTAGLLIGGWQSAEAGLIDWMEELSGPGPFTGYGGITATICDFRESPGALRLGQTKPCFFVDYRHLRTREKDDASEFGKVRANAFDFGVSWQLFRFLELGAGGGVILFDGNKDPARPTLTFARLAIKPVLLMIPYDCWEEHQTWAKWASVVKLYFKEGIILKNVNAGDFGVAPGASTFDVDYDKVTSFGVMFDVTEFWRPWR